MQHIWDDVSHMTISQALPLLRATMNNLRSLGTRLSLAWKFTKPMTRELLMIYAVTVMYHRYQCTLKEWTGGEM